MSDQTPTPAEPLDLTPDEAQCVAQRLCSRLLAEAVSTGLIEWGDLPELSERSWNRVQCAVEVVAREVKGRADALDIRLDIDSRDLMEKAS